MEQKRWTAEELRAKYGEIKEARILCVLKHVYELGVTTVDNKVWRIETGGDADRVYKYDATSTDWAEHVWAGVHSVEPYHRLFESDWVCYHHWREEKTQCACLGYKPCHSCGDDQKNFWEVKEHKGHNYCVWCIADDLDEWKQSSILNDDLAELRNDQALVMRCKLYLLWYRWYQLQTPGSGILSVTFPPTHLASFFVLECGDGDIITSL